MLIATATLNAQYFPERIGLDPTDAEYTAALRRECKQFAEVETSTLLDLEAEFQNRPTSGDLAGWQGLVCARALLYNREVPAPPRGALAGNGQRYDAAIAAALAATANGSSATFGAAILALLVFGEARTTDSEAVAVQLRRVLPRMHANRFRTVAIGCVTLALRDRTDGGAECAGAALARGVDSTWHLLALARLAARDGASLNSITSLFSLALSACHDQSARDALLWQLRWFTDGGEYDSLVHAPQSEFTTRIKSDLVRRDLRDARPPGSTLAAHFARLDQADAHFRTGMARAKAGTRTGAASNFVATPATRDTIRNVAAWYEPGLIAAEPFREFIRWDWRYDDRAYVWVRYGAPDRRVRWSASDTARSLGHSVQLEGIPGGNTREAWWYVTPAGPRLLQFEVEDFSGSVEATRLIAGGLGSYLCGINKTRCALTRQSANAFAFNWQGSITPSTPMHVPREALAAITRQDRNTIDTVMSTDDNHRDDVTLVPFVGSMLRTWSPRCRCWQALIVTAVKAQSVSPYTGSGNIERFRYVVRQWSRTTGKWSADTIRRRHPIPGGLPDDAWVTDTMTLPAIPGLAQWGVMLSPVRGMLGNASGRFAPLPKPFPREVGSDLILGSRHQQRSWKSPGGTRVTLAPLGTFTVDEPISFYWQVVGVSPGTNYTLTIELTAGGGNEAQVRVASDLTPAEGVIEIVRELDLHQLDPGQYQLKATLDGPSGPPIVREAPVLLLKGKT